MALFVKTLIKIIGDKIMAITLTDNEFFTGLTNLALNMRLYATNTSRFADNFVDSFATDTLASGNQKLFVFSELPSVGDYSETSSLLTVTKVDTNEENIVVTEKKVVKSSFNKYILDMAFTSESGMNEFMGYLLGQMESAKTSYIYNQIITDLFAKTFDNTENRKQLNEVTLIDETKISDITQLNNAQIINQKRIYLAIQDVLQNIQTYTNVYNKKKYMQALDVDDMRFVYCNPYANEQVVNLFASLLKSEVIKDEFKTPITQIIPSIKIPDGKANVIGILMHKYAYQFFYKFTYMGSFFDVSNLCINNFLHFWFGKGWLDNLPAVEFTVKTSA